MATRQMFGYFYHGLHAYSVHLNLQMLQPLSGSGNLMHFYVKVDSSIS